MTRIFFRVKIEFPLKVVIEMHSPQTPSSSVLKTPPRVLTEVIGSSDWFYDISASNAEDTLWIKGRSRRYTLRYPLTPQNFDEAGNALIIPLKKEMGNVLMNIYFPLEEAGGYHTTEIFIKKEDGETLIDSFENSPEIKSDSLADLSALLPLSSKLNFTLKIYFNGTRWKKHTKNVAMDFLCFSEAEADSFRKNGAIPFQIGKTVLLLGGFSLEELKCEAGVFSLPFDVLPSSELRKNMEMDRNPYLENLYS